LISKWDVVTGEWRKLHNEELRDLYSSPSIIRMIKSRKMRWADHVARIGAKGNAYRLLLEISQRERDNQEDQDVGVRIMLGCLRGGMG
jgi:hypothetical protein